MPRANAERIVFDCLAALARYYGGGAKPGDFARPSGKRARTASAWTRAEITFVERRALAAGLEVKRERAAGRRLPPDLVIEKRSKLVVHLERETRGWEWNHVIGALVKMLLLDDEPAPVAFLVLANVGNDPGERRELVLLLARRLLVGAPRVRRLYVALWLGKDWKDAQIFRISAPRRVGAAAAVWQVVPKSRRMKDLADF